MRIAARPRIEDVGIGKALRIPVGGAEQKADLLTLPQGDAGELDVLQRVAGEEMQGRVEPQQFFDRRGDGALAPERRAGVDAMFEHDLHPVADGVDRRFVAGVQKQDNGRDQLAFAQFAPLLSAIRSWLMRSSPRSRRRARA